MMPERAASAQQNGAICTDFANRLLYRCNNYFPGESRINIATIKFIINLLQVLIEYSRLNSPLPHFECPR